MRHASDQAAPDQPRTVPAWAHQWLARVGPTRRRIVFGERGAKRHPAASPPLSR